MERWWRRLLRGAGISLAALTAANSVHAAMVRIERDAWVHFRFDGRNGSVGSNTVVAEAHGPGAAVRFFTDTTFARRALSTGVGAALNLQAEASACNRDPRARDTTTVTVSSASTGASRVIRLVETDLNSGIFRTTDEGPVGARPLAANSAALRTVPSAPGDRLTALVNDCDTDPTPVEASLLVDPSGVVFDRTRNRALAGLRVTLIDVGGSTNGGRPGEPAVVLGDDGVTPVDSTVITDANGRFRFGLVPIGWYRVDVAIPPGWRRAVPAEVDKAEHGRTIVPDASFGERFENTNEMAPLLFDVPLEPVPSGLSVQKTASRSSVEIAESLAYTVLAKNVGEVDLDGVELVDTLPFGFAYLPGSTRVDGRPAVDPATAGRTLRFAAGALARDAGRTVEYRVVVRTSALQGDGVNRVMAHSVSPVVATSNEASAGVTVSAGVFASEATVLGMVFADCNADGLKDPDEPGVPGVRLLMEDGTSVVTDGQGRYSLYGLSPRTHVLKIDRTTLPAGAEPRLTSQRQAGEASSRFVDPRRSELQRADFALAACSPAQREAIAERRAAAGAERELRQSLRTELPLSRAPVGDVKSLPAAGTVGDVGAVPTPAPAAAPAAASAPEEVATGLAILGLDDDAVLPNRPLTLRTRSRADAPLRLEIGGRAVDEGRVGKRESDAGTGVEHREYIGLVLPAGATTVALVQLDPFGNERARVTRRVRVAGPLAALRLTPATDRAPSDGETTVAVTLALLDRDGLPAAERHAVTLTATAGDWDVLDLDPVTPGVQTFVDGATATWHLRAPNAAARADLQATVDGRSATARTDFTAPLRPMVMAGIVEGVLDLRRLDPRHVVPASAGDGFEDELRTFASGDDTTAKGRAAVFLKGKVLGEHLLTLGYDSDKDRRTRLFRDIQPDTFYPVYGDDAVKGFDAQSTGRLYVKLEKDRSYTLYGDFTTQTPTAARQLGTYQRSLTGLRQHVETERVTADLFVSHDNARQVVRELPGNGTSGPFLVGGAGVVPQSERVEVIVRDRNQPGRIVSVTTKQRFADYDFEPLSGTLLFHAPIPSVDADLNPVSVRVTFEVDQGGPSFYVAGGDVQVAVTDTVSVGGSLVRDLNPLDTRTLSSVNTTWRPTPTTTVVAEAAQLHREPGDGSAQRIEVQHGAPGALQVRAYAGRSDIGFTNPSSTLAPGRREAAVKASQPIDERTRVVADAVSTGDALGHTRRDGVLVGVERGFGAAAKVEAGLRWVEDHPLPGVADNDTRSVRVKVGSQVPGLPRASAYAEAEQDVNDSDKRLFALGGAYQLENNGRVYARHELISSLGGAFLLDPNQRRNTTVIGVDGDVMTDGRLFGEYRGRDAFGDRETEAAIGLRNRWRIADGLRLGTSFERVSALSGPATNDSVAATAAIEYTANPLWKGTARLEARHATAGDTFLASLGLARKLNADWTALVKNTYATAHADGQPTRLQERFQAGVAYRDTATNRLNGLGRYEFRRDSGVAGGDLARKVHVLSTHVEGQPARQVTLTGMVAAKWVQEAGDALDLSHSAQMATLRAGRDLGDRWDVGVALRLLTDGGLSRRQQGVGVEGGYRVQEQTWVSVGWNASGFRDRDLSEDRSTQRGVYLRLRMKFDESLLSGVSL